MKPLTPLQKKLLKWVGIPAFYLVSLFIFVRLTFPYETLKRRLVAEFNSRSKDKRLDIDRLSGSGFFGVEAEGIRLAEIVIFKPGEKMPKPHMLYVERAAVSVSPLSVLFGGISVSFDADVGGGEVEGSFSQSDAEARIEVIGENVDISGLTMLSKSVGLPMGGTLGGEVNLYLPERRMTKAEGSFDLSIVDLTVGDGKAKIRNTIALPKLKAGTLVLKAEAADGRMEVSEFGSDGRDIAIEAGGKLRLREPFDKSTADLDVGFQFKEAYTDKSDMTRSLFGSKSSKVPGLFDMDPTVRKAKDPEGFYRWRVTGLLSRPNFRPGQSRSRKPSPGAAKP